MSQADDAKMFRVYSRSLNALNPEVALNALRPSQGLIALKEALIEMDNLF